MSLKRMTVLHFLVQDTQACISLHSVEKVLPLPLLEVVPSCPVYCAGLMNFKGQCIPILDLAIGIGLPREQIYSLNTPILLCSDKGHQVGLIVDKVLGMSNIDENKIEIQEHFTQKESPFLGAITLESGVSMLINMDWVFALQLIPETN